MTAEIEFQPWPKIARLNREITVTEKLDGTNSAIIIEEGAIGAQSRSRLLTVDDDNYEFAAWVSDNAGALYDTLGVGRHFGEWWGWKIQRGYGLPRGDRRFSLFNTKRWAYEDLPVDGLGAVPVLYQGPFSQYAIDACIENLRVNGSQAAPFLDPEGIVVYHSAANEMFKVTLEGDEEPKSRRGAA